MKKICTLFLVYATITCIYAQNPIVVEAYDEQWNNSRNIQLESGSKVQFINPGKKTVIHLNGSTIWRSRTLNEDLEEVARGFMLIQHSNETMTVEGMWAGTIFAPNADLILGQSSKTLYGKFIGRNIAVHQYSNVYNVNFEPNELTELVLREN